jgi:hypothetical protein
MCFSEIRVKRIRVNQGLGPSFITVSCLQAKQIIKKLTLGLSFRGIKLWELSYVIPFKNYAWQKY